MDDKDSFVVRVGVASQQLATRHEYLDMGGNRSSMNGYISTKSPSNNKASY